MSLLILVVDDEADVEVLFRQQFRRDLRAELPEWRSSVSLMREEVSLILILSDINMPGMSGLLALAQGQSNETGRSRHHDHRLRRCGDERQGF